MASSRSIPSRSLNSSERRYRRSAFNGAKQLSASQAPNRRVLALLAVLALGLFVALAVIVGVHVQRTDDATPSLPASAIHQANH
jgi:hypothetical protein